MPSTPLSALALLLAVTPAAAARRPPCPPGAFVLHTGARLLASATGTRDVVRLAADPASGHRVALVGACPPARARIRATRAGTRVTATWGRRACGDGVGRVRLRALVAEGCELLRGRLKVARTRPVAFTAPRCALDGAVDAAAGEECASVDVCAPGLACVDCRCVPRVSFVRDLEPVFARSCTASACHGGEHAPGGFQLVPELAYEALRGLAARAGPCAGSPLIAPGAPDGSALFERVSGLACGSRMPVGPTPLAPEQVDAIRRWIAQGAGPE